MLDMCRQCHISLNNMKCIFSTPFGIFLGHVVCIQGLLVDPTNIVVILNLPPPKSVRWLRAILGHTGYYMNFINGYAQITRVDGTDVEKGHQISMERGLSVGI
jgi:hypothetical protein